MPSQNDHMTSLIENIQSLIDDNDLELADGLSALQKDLIVSILKVIKYGFERYNDTNYGSCQNIPQIKDRYDPPADYSSPEKIDNVVLFTNFSNLGINKIPNNKEFIDWWKSVDNELPRAFSDKYALDLVNWIYDFFKLQRPTHDNLYEIIYTLASFIIYVVFGDPVFHFKGNDRLVTDNTNFTTIINYIAKNVFASSSWNVFLDELNDKITAKFTPDQESLKEDVTIEHNDVFHFVSWVLNTFLPKLNQVQDNEDSDLTFGDTFPSFPSGLWILANTILATAFSFMVGGAKAKFGKKYDGSIKWIPSVGLKDEGREQYQYDDSFYEDGRSPFRGFAVDNVWFEGTVIVVKFTEEIADANFEVLHPSILTANRYEVKLSGAVRTIQNVSVHSEDRDKILLAVQGISSFNGNIKVRIGCSDQNPIFNENLERDPCSPWSQNFKSEDTLGVTLGANKDVRSGLTLGHRIVWIAERPDRLLRTFDYLIDWHRRHLEQEYYEAYNILQSIGWMNAKGSNFSGFLHPDSACGAYVENIYKEYYSNIQKECVELHIERSFGNFKCNDLFWSAQCNNNITIVTKTGPATLGANIPSEVGFLFGKKVDDTYHVNSYGTYDEDNISPVSICGYECLDCSNDVFKDSELLLLNDEKDVKEAQIEVLETAINSGSLGNKELALKRAQLYQASTRLSEINELIQQIEQDNTVCGNWRLIRQGTETSNEGPECLLGWNYNESGEIDSDSTRLMNGAKFITVNDPPEKILIDKLGDLWVNGQKIARVAFSALSNHNFGVFTNLTSNAMIHPRYIGDKRIFHVMQKGIRIWDSPNILRDELKRLNLIPYHIGNFFHNRKVNCDGAVTPEDNVEKSNSTIHENLPDCFTLAGRSIETPRWFKDWYSRHNDSITGSESRYLNNARTLFLKLPYDKRFIGDPMRYTYEEQIAFSYAILDLVASFFESMPFSIQNGLSYSLWYDEYLNPDPFGFPMGYNHRLSVERRLNILPITKNDIQSKTKFNIANWSFGTNSNSPFVRNDPVRVQNSGRLVTCVECCDLIESDCESILEFEDCCESAIGRWQKNKEYLQGDIVFGLDGTNCYEALIDVCAGDCSIEPGHETSSTIWRKCNPDCEADVPTCNFVLSNEQEFIGGVSCEGKVTIAALYSITQEPEQKCNYKWIFSAINIMSPADTVTVEYIGKYPGELQGGGTNSIILCNFPLFPTSLNKNKWKFSLEVRSLIADKLLCSHFSLARQINISCDFDINIWTGQEALLSEAYNWCDEYDAEDAPYGKLAPSPESQLGDLMADVEQAYENMLIAYDEDI